MLRPVTLPLPLVFLLGHNGVHFIQDSSTLLQDILDALKGLVRISRRGHGSKHAVEQVTYFSRGQTIVLFNNGAYLLRNQSKTRDGPRGSQEVLGDDLLGSSQVVQKQSKCGASRDKGKDWRKDCHISRNGGKVGREQQA